jgi:hypothetical protein
MHLLKKKKALEFSVFTFSLQEVKYLEKSDPSEALKQQKIADSV